MVMVVMVVEHLVRLKYVVTTKNEVELEKQFQQEHIDHLKKFLTNFH